MNIIQNNKIDKYFIVIFLFFIILLTYASTACAELNSSGILDNVYEKYTEETAKWQNTLTSVATNIFYSLMFISMIWTFAQLLFQRHSSFTEFFGELIRFMMFSGTYLWFLQNGVSIALSITDSFTLLAGTASGQNFTSPSDIVDIGFQVYEKACSKIDLFDNFTTSLICALTALIILIILALVAINLLLQLCSVWVLAYAGIIFLGFGGSKWTSDIAVNYFKTVIGAGASLMVMILLVGIGRTIINECFDSMSPQSNTNEMAVMLVASLTLLHLVEKLPSMIAGIVTGASIGQAIGSFGAGAAAGAGMTGGNLAMKSGGFAAKATGLSAAAGYAKKGIKSGLKNGAKSLASSAFKKGGE